MGKRKTKWEGEIWVSSSFFIGIFEKTTVAQSPVLCKINRLHFRPVISQIPFCVETGQSFKFGFD